MIIDPNQQTTLRRSRQLHRGRVAVVSAGAVVALCGGAAATANAYTGARATETATTVSDTAASDMSVIELTVTDTSIDGLPAEVPAGVVEVVVTDETEGAGAEVDFTLVEPGTDVAAFPADLEVLFGGGPFPDYFLNNSGAVGRSMITLDEGEYIVWVDLAANLDRPSTADDIIAVPFTVSAGDDDAAIGETDGLIRAADYEFEVDVAAGGSTVTFLNEGQEFHHVVIVDFGTNDPALVEENLLTLLTGGPESSAPAGSMPMESMPMESMPMESAPMDTMATGSMPTDSMSEGSMPTGSMPMGPGGIDMSQVNFEFALSGVFGTGSSGTFEVTFESGRTYAALCFIPDRAGGAPHAIQYDMYEVFTVE